MARTVGIGIDDFETMIKDNLFYVDKTHLIKEWVDNHDKVTLIARPRRFGRTLNMSMLEYCFCNQYGKQEAICSKLNIWKEEGYRELAGKYPVISLSFANVKDDNYEDAVSSICEIFKRLYNKHAFLLDSKKLTDPEREHVKKMLGNVTRKDVKSALNLLSEYLFKHFEKKVLIFLDEYDTPMQEAYLGGYWDAFASFIRNFFNAAFKTNPYLDKAILTGITRVSKESIFSDLNNLEVVTTTSNKYETCFGMTEEEVFAAMDEQGLANKEEVKKWYDGFIFGKKTDIYNPWSITYYLNERKIGIYWANTSSNSLVGRLLSRGDKDIKMDFEALLKGEAIQTSMDEQIIFDQLERKTGAIWSLLVASGYLKVIDFEGNVDEN